MWGLYCHSGQMFSKRKSALMQISFWSIGAFFALLINDSRAGNVNNLPDSVTNQWSKYIDSAKLYRTKHVSKRFRIENGKKKLISEDILDIILGDDYGRVLSLSRDFASKNKDEKGLVAGFNSKYAFKLKQSSAERYILEKLDVNPANGIHFDQELPKRLKIDKYPGLSIHGMWLPDVLQSPACQILELESVKEDDIPLLKIRFNYQQHTQINQDAIVPWEGSIFLDERKGFLIRRYQLSYSYPKFKGFDITENELTINQDSIPLVKQRKSGYRYAPLKSPELEFEETVEYTIEPKEYTESDCTLSAFGLPEPKNTHRPTRRYLWMAIAALVCLGLAVFFRWRARRVGPTPESP